MFFKNIFYALGVGLFSCFIWFQISEIPYYKASSNWPIVRAEIISIESRSCARGSTSRKINYEYVVDKKTYISDRIMFVTLACSISHSILEKYHEGEFVDAYYDVNYPKRSVLIVGKMPTGTLGSIFLNFLIVFVILFCWYYEYQDMKAKADRSVIKLFH
jgi:hypothetical protein